MNNITSFLQKSFSTLTSGIVIPFGIIAHELAKCAKAQSYVETFDGHSDSLHHWIKEGYEEDFKKSYEEIVRKALLRLGVSYARIAIDFTNEPFYGRTRSIYIFNTSGEKYEGEFKFLVVCLIIRNKQIPLMALPIRVGEGIARPTIEILEYTRMLFKSIRFAVFDRGFYCAELIDYLEANHIKYIIFVPEKKGEILDFFNATEIFGKMKHEMLYSKKKSKWKPETTLVVCKRIGKDKAGNYLDWIFATNINFKTRVEYVFYYMRRWQIETNFRVEDEAKIKSKSTNYLIRYFYFLISLLFHLLWIVDKNINGSIQFKKYLDRVEHLLLYDYLGINGVS